MKNNTPLRVVHPESLKDFVPAVEIMDFNAWYGNPHILNNINLTFQRKRVNCIIGPSGSGKSTLIRSINRINDDDEGFTPKGAILFNGKNVYDRSVDVTCLRTQIGMVFQRPCIFPKSITENVLFGLRHIKKLSRHERLQVAEENLRAVSLWKEVSHRLGDRAHSLSIGQQQRLCIARALAMKPEVVLLDEPTSSLDPVSTRAIEDLMLTLKKDYTIVFVTHSIQQARRIADRLIFMCDGKIIEEGDKEKLFADPENEQTRNFLNEEFCEC